MAITFQEQRNRQHYFIIAVLGIVVLTIIILWRGFFVKPSQETSGIISSQAPHLSIDFGVFDTPSFKDVAAARDPVQPPQEVGRQNPFIPFAK